jgi:hypothetical protein
LPCLFQTFSLNTMRKPSRFVIPLEDIVATVVIVAVLAGLTFIVLRWLR